MKKTFEGWLFNRMELLGGEQFNHVGCEGDNEQFIDLLSYFVPEVGMKRRVKFIIESDDEPEFVEEYKTSKDYVKDK